MSGKHEIFAGTRPRGQAEADAPSSICLLRLSAIGDIVQVIPTVRALQRRFPDASITWIVGTREAELVGNLDGVEVVPFDKRSAVASTAGLARDLRGRRFDVLLHLHPSMRANLASLAVRARRRVGYDRARSSELQGLFVNRRIPPDGGRHVLESFLAFAHFLGAGEAPPRWDLPLGDEERAFARIHLPEARPHLVVSPCSSRPVRDWHARGYAEVAAHAIGRHGMGIVLCGGPGAREREMGRAIEEALGRSVGNPPVTNLIGRDTLRKLLAVLERATALVSPDSGPAHMASAVGTPVVGLFAATDPTRSGPYGSIKWCVDRFDEAARRFRGRPASDLPWRTKIEEPGVMDLIEPAAVIERLDAVMAARAGAPGPGPQAGDAPPVPDPDP